MLGPLIVALLLGTPTISGNADCPSVQEVSDAIASLNAPELERLRGSVVLFRTGNALTVALLGAKDEPLAERRLQLGSDCHRAATAVAVVVTAWAAVFQSDEPPVKPREPTVRSEPVVTARAEPWRLLHLEIGAGVLLAATADGAVPAGMVLAALERPRTPWGGLLALQIEGASRLVISPAAASWQRFSGALGPSYRLSWTWGALAFDADGVLAVLLAHGNGSGEDLAASTFDLGARLGVRLSLGRGTPRVWCGAWETLFLRPTDLVIAPGTAEVPRWAFAAGLGGTLDLF